MKVKKIIGLIAICVLGAISLGSFFGLARTTINDIAGFDFKTVNEANYFNVDSYLITNADSSAMVELDINDDGEIYVEFDNSEGESEIEIPLQNLTLEKGEYVFKSGVRKSSKDNYYLVLKETDASGSSIEDSDVIYADDTFEINETTYYKAFIGVAAGKKCEVTFTPILVEDGEKESFYVYDFNIFDND